MSPSDWAASGGGDGPWRWVSPEPQRWVVVSAGEQDGTIDLRADDGPWRGATVRMSEVPLPMVQWCQGRIGKVVTLQEIYAANPE